MTTSVKAILAICALALLVGVKPATAETARPNIPHVAPGTVQEMIAPAATVVSTVHYQVLIGFDCGSSGCSGSFPPAGVKHRLNITRITCLIGTFGSTSVTYAHGLIANNAGTFSQYLPVDYATPYEMVLNQAVDMQVTGGNQYTVVYLTVANLTAGSASCSASGTRDTLG